jgi:RNA polymerase sigma-70 factor, ECF subfamily
MRTMTVSAVQNGSASVNEAASQAFSLLVSAYWPRIFRFLLSSTHDIDLAETLTQESFLQAYRHWSSFRGDSSPFTWLTRIAINQLNDYWRNRRMRFWRQTRTNSFDVNEAGDQFPSSERSPEQRVLARERVGLLWKAVNRLSPRQKTVFLLRYAEGRELREIVGSTGMRMSSVKAHLSRAVAKVRVELAGS